MIKRRGLWLVESVLGLLLWMLIVVEMLMTLQLGVGLNVVVSRGSGLVTYWGRGFPLV